MTIQRQKITALVLAAGKGTRMGEGRKPKVLYKLAGKTMLEHVLETLYSMSLSHYCVVLGKKWEEFKPFLGPYDSLRVCVQEQQNGTAGAVASSSYLFNDTPPIEYGRGDLVLGEPIPREGSVLVCYGDTPLLERELLESFAQDYEERGSELSVLGMNHPSPTGYGRLLLGETGELESIVEEKDASSEERKVTLCNSGIIMIKVGLLFKLLRKVENKNIQKEFYLTDLVSLAKKEGSLIHAFVTDKWNRLTGVNTQDQLKEAEELFTSV